LLLPVTVDWEAWPQAVLERPEELATLATAWAAEFERNVQPAFMPTLDRGELTYPRLMEDDWLGLDELNERQVLQQDTDIEFLGFVEDGNGVDDGEGVLQ
jgi:hypothetical protein